MYAVIAMFNSISLSTTLIGPLVRIRACFAQRHCSALQPLNAGTLKSGEALQGLLYCQCGPTDLALPRLPKQLNLRHSNPTIQHAKACYVLAISHLINYPGDNSGAFLAVRDYVNAEGDEDIND